MGRERPPISLVYRRANGKFSPITVTRIGTMRNKIYRIVVWRILSLIRLHKHTRSDQRRAFPDESAHDITMPPRSRLGVHLGARWTRGQRLSHGHYRSRVTRVRLIRKYLRDHRGTNCAADYSNACIAIYKSFVYSSPGNALETHPRKCPILSTESSVRNLILQEKRSVFARPNRSHKQHVHNTHTHACTYHLYPRPTKTIFVRARSSERCYAPIIHTYID